MDSATIEDKVDKMLPPGNLFVGVFSSNTLPHREPPYCFITNTQPDNEKGEHWVAFWVEHNFVEFFDSYGRSPENSMFPETFSNFVKNKKCFYNNLILEGIFSKTCGHFCIYFIVLKSFGADFETILNTFSDSRIVNDNFVKRFVKWI